MKIRPSLTGDGHVVYHLTGPASALHDHPTQRRRDSTTCDSCGADPYAGGLAFMVATFQDEAAQWWCTNCVRGVLMGEIAP